MAEEPNLHLSVLCDAFEDVKSSKDTLTVNNIVINRGLVVLFSPFLQDLLASIPNSSSDHAHITLPDISLFSILNLSELLLHGTCANVKSTGDARDLFITLRALGIDVQRLEIGSDGTEEEVVINVASADAAEINQHQGRKVVITYDLPINEEAVAEQNNEGQNNSEHQPAKPSSPLPPPPPIQIKKEKTNESDTPEAPNPQAFCNPQPDPEPEAPMETEVVTPQEPKETELRQATEKVETKVTQKLETNMCRKCNKHFPTVMMLKNHYCGHFLSLIKKKFQSSYKDLTCLENMCNKSFPSVQKLLVHIGVFHDRINQILKMKGIEELPPNTMPSQNKTQIDIKNVPLIQPTSKPAAKSQTPEKPITTSKPPKKVSPAPSTPVAPEPPQTPARKIPESDSPAPVPQTPAEKKSLDAECNFSQECQVCKQKMTSLHLLEQHLCRHFMKEIAETYKDLQDDLKCTLCASVFKQKHSLVLHIGCKHGKINEILKSKNFPVLPAPVLNNPTSAMQKQLQKVKKEKIEKTETPMKQTNANVVKETLSEATPNVSALLSAQSLLQPTSEPTSMTSQSLDDILKKYNMNITTSKAK